MLIAEMSETLENEKKLSVGRIRNVLTFLY